MRESRQRGELLSRRGGNATRGRASRPRRTQPGKARTNAPPAELVGRRQNVRRQVGRRFRSHLHAQNEAIAWFLLGPFQMHERKALIFCHHFCFWFEECQQLT